MIKAAVITTLLMTTRAQSNKTVARWGTEPIKMSHIYDENLMPSFFFMAGGEEGGSYTPPSGGYAGGLGDPRPFSPPDSCPDELFNHTMKDLRVPVLPYLEQDDWGCEAKGAKPSAVPVIEIENDYLRGAITPQWGGKVWSMYDKTHKEQLFFNNPAHQPENIAYRKAWTSGGCEWNWGAGYIGHSVFTESATFSAKMPTEYGDVVRVWEFDRINSTVWQVDILLDEDVFWAHARVTNPHKEEQNGYWWTCVAMPVTETSRIITPAKISITPCTAWPYGAHTEPNVTFRGAPVDGCDAQPGAPHDPHCAWQQDMSWLGNIPGPHDFFFHKTAPEAHFELPYIVHAREDGWSVVHSHPLEGTKFFTWGAGMFGQFQQDFMSASDYENEKCRQSYTDKNRTWELIYSMHALDCLP